MNDPQVVSISASLVWPKARNTPYATRMKSQCLSDLVFDLRGPAEDMPVVLVEPSDARQAAQSARDLVTVERAEVGIPDREVAIAAQFGRENEAVAGAVHRLEADTRPARCFAVFSARDGDPLVTVNISSA